MVDFDSFSVAERALLVGALVLAMLGIAGTIALIGYSMNKRKESGGFEVNPGKAKKVKAPKKNKKGELINVDPGDQAFAHLASQAADDDWGSTEVTPSAGPFSGQTQVPVQQPLPAMGFPQAPPSVPQVAPVAFPPAPVQQPLPAMGFPQAPPSVPQVAPVAFPPAPIAPAPVSPTPVAPAPIAPAPVTPIPPPANRPGLPPRAPSAARPEPTIAPVAAPAQVPAPAPVAAPVAVPAPTPAPGAPGPFGDADSQGADW